MSAREMKDFLEALCRRLARQGVVAPCAAGLIAGAGLAGCTDGPAAEEASAVEVCDDGEDNDGDGKSDCDDEDCAASCGELYGAPPAEICDDGEDNDGDGRTDEDDTDCLEVVAMYSAPGCTMDVAAPAAAAPQAGVRPWAGLVRLVALRHPVKLVRRSGQPGPERKRKR